jgi:uncharacterized protein (TIGR02265 family)
VLFVDYVRMVRGRKDIRWGDELEAEDLMILAQKVDATGWYPMETFERLGVAILKKIALGQLEGVRMWGRFQLNAVRKEFPMLVADGDPRETLMRFDVLAESFFDYGALGVHSMSDGHAYMWIRYQMGKVAEETASYQTMGFFEGLLEAAGAKDIHARFTAKAWEGAERTMVELHWA